MAYQVQQSVGSQIQRSVASLNQRKHCDKPNNKNQSQRARLAGAEWRAGDPYELGLSN